MISKNCSYILRVPIGHIVKFEFVQLDIEFHRKCLFDYVQIDGQRYCGQSIPGPIYSMTNELSVIYFNDATKPSKGFRAKYEMVEIGCGGVIKQGEPLMTISPESIKDNIPVHQCLWEIQANKSSIVKLKFFQPETVVHTRYRTKSSNPLVMSYNCDLNYVMVNDSDGSLIKRFCLNDLPPPIISSEQKIFITYVFNPLKPSNKSALFSGNSNQINSNEDNLIDLVTILLDYERKMFYANYFFIPTRNFCDKNIFKNTGMIKSPRFPRQYPPNRNCTWIIHVDNGMQVRLNFPVFKIEPKSIVNGQCYDYLEIRNGRQSNSPLIGIFCGNDPMPEIVSHSNYLFLRFISDLSLQNYGFKLLYEAMATGCGGLLTADSGSIESPGYPGRYYSNMNCEWQIRISQGSKISMVISAIDIEASNSGLCKFDYLEFFDGPSDGSPSLGKFCDNLNNVVKTMFVSKTNQLFIRFVTDHSGVHGGFRLTYRTLCNQTFAGRHGIIESPVRKQMVIYF